MTQFKELLDSQYSWPARYIFKFIVPSGKVVELKELLESLIDKVEVLERPSRSGKFISCSVHSTMSSSEDVLAIYDAVRRLDGVISL